MIQTVIVSVILATFIGLGIDSNAQVNVRTLGGGRTTAKGADAGFVDGNTLQNSQFNTPSGIAVDSAGRLYIADKGNGALRKLDIPANRSSTLLTGLSLPVALAMDQTNNLYFLTQGDGKLRKLDSFGNLTINPAAFASPTALALDTNHNAYITESSGNVVRLDLEAGTRDVIRAGLNSPAGIAVLQSGLLAVSESGANRLLFLDPINNGNIVAQIGTGIAGFRNGSIAMAQFNRPQQLAVASNGNIVVADRGNHRVRIVGTDNSVTTLYGVDPQSWEGPECTSCNPVILPGWFDGSADFAEARDPVGVAVAQNGTVYATEVFYHLIREVTGSPLTGGSNPGTGGPTGTVALPPVIRPQSGYYPLGQDITVINPNTNVFFSQAIYYTTDGTVPTTNSTRLKLNNAIGTIRWRETTRDLTSLRLIALSGSQSSEVVSGLSPATNEIGITREIMAGMGSTVIVPVTVNLRTNNPLKSLQYRFEIAPLTEATPPLIDQPRSLSISTNDFIPVVTSSQAGTVTTFNSIAYTNGTSRGMAITFIGTNANLSVNQFAAVGMFAVPIPPTAKAGDAYSVRIINPSGTSDGAQAAIPLRAMTPAKIVVDNVSYLVGDSSPATWYNAGPDRNPNAPDSGYGFGDGRLDNSDVNNAFAASLGVRIPYAGSDLFDAMDVFPEDSSDGAGGDGLIRFLDWQVVLQRSLGLDPANWIRRWSDGGALVAEPSLFRSAQLPANRLSAFSDSESWRSQALISAASLENAQPGSTVDVPVYVSVASGYRLGGLAFRATLDRQGGAPAIETALSFFPASGIAQPLQMTASSINELLCGWPLVPSPSFQPPLQGRQLLGTIRISVPVTVQPGQSFSLRFANPDGSPDLQTQYTFETLPGTVWFLSKALQKAQAIPDEWKIHFFGNSTDPSTADHADPDGDGFSNLAEYYAGSNPLDPASHLQFEISKSGASGKLTLRWSSVSGKHYSIEFCSDLKNQQWAIQASNLAGTGSVMEWQPANVPVGQSFYRLRVEPQFPSNQ